VDTTQASTAPVTSTVAPAPAAAPPTPPQPAEGAAPPAPAAGTQPAKPEPAAGAETEPEKKPIDVARGFAKLATEDQRIRTEREKLKAERAELTAARDALAKAKGSVREGMKLLGYDEDTVLRAIANGETATTAPTEADRVTSLERWKEERERKDAENATAAQRQREQHLETQFFDGVTKAIKDAGEKYELINDEGEHDEVEALIRGHFEKTQQLMPWGRAAELVEKALQEKEKARIERRAKKQQAAATPAPTKSETKKPPSETSAATTLTNGRLTAGPARIDVDDLPLDPDERTAEMNRRRAARGRAS
jgi:hypothetical protein